MSYYGLGFANSIVLYSSLINQIFTPVAQSFLCNPFFVVPSLYANYVLFDKYYVYMFGARSHIQNMYLLPNGKEVIVETRDGQNKTIKNKWFYSPKIIKTGWEDRIDLGYGANNYLYIKGRSQINDMEILEAVLLNKVIDTNNVAFDYDVSNDFTWNPKEIVEIKKRRRRVVRYYKPTARVLLKLASAANWERQKELGIVKDKREIVPNYVLYKFNPDVYDPNPSAQLPGERGEILPGDPLYKAPILKETI